LPDIGKLHRVKSADRTRRCGEMRRAGWVVEVPRTALVGSVDRIW
jgi:hypothetical protein